MRTFLIFFFKEINFFFEFIGVFLSYKIIFRVIFYFMLDLEGDIDNFLVCGGHYCNLKFG